MAFGTVRSTLRQESNQVFVRAYCATYLLEGTLYYCVRQHTHGGRENTGREPQPRDFQKEPSFVETMQHRSFLAFVLSGFRKDFPDRQTKFSVAPTRIN